MHRVKGFRSKVGPKFLIIFSRTLMTEGSGAKLTTRLIIEVLKNY